MNKLLIYLNGIVPSDQVLFADRCGTSVGYLRKAISARQKLGVSLCINIERESMREVCCEDLRPDVDWNFIRGTSKSNSVVLKTSPNLDLGNQKNPTSLSEKREVGGANG